MKNLTTLSVLLCLACAKPGSDAEKELITRLIDDETRYAAAADSVNWANCWVNTEEALFTYVSTDGPHQYKGWNNIKSFMKDAKPFDLKLRRDNYNFTIGRDVTFASFDQYDNWGGMDGRKTKETRTLKKIGGSWKIVDVNVVEVSAFERPATGSYHIAKEKIAVDPRTSFSQPDRAWRNGCCLLGSTCRDRFFHVVNRLTSGHVHCTTLGICHRWRYPDEIPRWKRGSGKSR